MASSPNYLRRPFLDPPKSFQRDPNGLVNLDTYTDYLVDHPDDAPIEIVGSQRNIWMYQHLYFQRPFYQQQNVSRYMRDRILADFSNSPYNQLAMRRTKEVQLHKEREEHVFAPPPETMKKSLADFRNLDILGAAAVGKRVALVPEALECLVPGATVPKQTLKYSIREKAEFFDGELERALQALRSPLVTPQRVITGAIHRTTRLLNSKLLNDEAERRLKEDSIYYPVGVRKLGHLYSLSNQLLENICSVEGVKANEETSLGGLQTEANALELAA